MRNAIIFSKQVERTFERKFVKSHVIIVVTLQINLPSVGLNATGAIDKRAKISSVEIFE